MLKVFLEICASPFKMLLNMETTLQDSLRMAWNAENQLKCPFFLQVYETQFSSRVEPDRFDLKSYILEDSRALHMLEKYSLRE